MEKRGVVLFFGAWLACCSISTATVTNLNPNESVNLANYLDPTGNSILIGDKLFDDFTFIAGGNTNVFGAMTVSLAALSNSIGFGLSFSAPFHTSGTELKDFIIKYSVTVTNAAFLISDIHLDYNGSHVAGGFSTITETIYDSGGFGGNLLNQIVAQDPPPGQLSTNAFLAVPQAQLFVQKDILLGGENTGDSASISAINQVFSQVAIPEPSSITLAVAGLAGLWVLRRRRH